MLRESISQKAAVRCIARRRVASIEIFTAREAPGANEICVFGGTFKVCVIECSNIAGEERVLLSYFAMPQMIAF